MRARRRGLSPLERSVRAQRVARRLATAAIFLRSRRIAAYLAHDGELDPAPLLRRAWAMGKRCYLPVLKPNPFSGLWFAHYEPGDPLRPNRFRIPEPSRFRQRCTPPWGLDLVLVPLVAFDPSGNRLGMGGGYYDRTFDYRRKRRCKRPQLIGVAYEFQKVETLPQKPWDIPLDAILTDVAWYSGERSERGD